MLVNNVTKKTTTVNFCKLFTVESIQEINTKINLISKAIEYIKFIL